MIFLIIAAQILLFTIIIIICATIGLICGSVCGVVGGIIWAIRKFAWLLPSGNSDNDFDHI